MQNCNCEAIILGMSDYRESDRIVTFFTRDHGKVRGIARGAKRSVRRFGGSLELFACLRLQIVLREGLSTLQEADVVTVYPRIRDDLEKIGYAGYACELVDQLAPEGMANPRLYRLLTAYLERLDTASVDPSDRAFFDINLLNILGYRPALDHCAACGAESSAGTVQLTAGAGGELFCGSCRRGGRLISAGTIALLDRALHTGRFGAVTFAGEELREAAALLDAALAPHLHRPLKSLAFLRETAE